MNIDFKRLNFKARRGMLELDLLLKKFLKKEFNNMTEINIQQFENLMELHDPELLDLLINENTKNSKFIKHKDIINNIIMTK